MRLIAADKLNFQGQHYNKSQMKAILDFIDAQPTAYDVDKVVKQLETARDGYSAAQLMTATNDELVKRFIAKEKAMNLAIEIVKAGRRMTNAERIRNMSDEELADFIVGLNLHCLAGFGKCDCRANKACDNCDVEVKKWLQQKSEG